MWKRLNVALVLGDNADAFVSFGATQTLGQHVALDLEELLGNASTAVGSLKVRLDVVGYGRVRCILSTADAGTSHCFSDVSPPFDIWRNAVSARAFTADRRQATACDGHVRGAAREL